MSSVCKISSFVTIVMENYPVFADLIISLCLIVHQLVIGSNGNDQFCLQNCLWKRTLTDSVHKLVIQSWFDSFFFFLLLLIPRFRNTCVQEEWLQGISFSYSFAKEVIVIFAFLQVIFCHVVYSDLALCKLLFVKVTYCPIYCSSLRFMYCPAQDKR